MRFLIVDDAEAPLKYLERFLEEAGHEVAGRARNGVEAVEAFERLRPDVVILDVIMPRMNGLDALRAIHGIDPQAAVIMSSSLQSCQTALEAERLGARYCLSKPFEAPRLRKVVECIARELGKRAARRARPATRLATA